MAPAAEQELVRRAQAGGPRPRPSCSNICIRSSASTSRLFLGFGTLAEDAVQETMLQLYRSLSGFRGQSSAKTWALRIAGRTAHRYARTQRKHLDALPTTDDLDDEIFGVTEDVPLEDTRHLIAALGELAPKKREAFVLMEVFELSAREAGAALGVFANTAASRCRHAKAELVENLRGEV